jgi:CHAD domain-containing protein
MNRGPTLVNTAASVGPYVVARLRALEERLDQAAERVVSTAEDAEAVHDLRVALRRARTVLEVSRPVLGRFYVDEVRRALRDVQRATGALRDEEVLLELVRSLGVEHDDVGRWLESRARRERRLRGALVRLVRGGGLKPGRRLLDALLAFRVKPSRDKRLAKFARRAVEGARREVERRRGAHTDDGDALHRLRIAYKRLRYTVETFAEVLPGDLAALAQPSARFQGRLGELHDVDMAVACVRRARALSTEAREALLAALARERTVRLAAFAREQGVQSIAPVAATTAAPLQAVGTDGLRKISTR